MNYQKIHDQIIERAKVRNLTDRKKIYFETHHIIPRCLGGTDDSCNKVNLLAREHFLIHWLLHRIYPDNAKLSWAFFRCTQFNQARERFTISSRTYAEAKECKRKHDYETDRISQVECEHCHKVTRHSHHNQFHGERCKHNPNQSAEELVRRKEFSVSRTKLQVGKKHKKHKLPKKYQCIHCHNLFAMNVLNKFHNDNCVYNALLTEEERQNMILKRKHKTHKKGYKHKDPIQSSINYSNAKKNISKTQQHKDNLSKAIIALNQRKRHNKQKLKAA